MFGSLVNVQSTHKITLSGAQDPQRSSRPSAELKREALGAYEP
jgi:hypothetical protein